MFEREFVETQEAHGIYVLGQFRDLDDPDHFVWLRGFDDMAARHRGLQGFYEGPVWARHREAANATMINSDNVLLLRPAFLDSGLSRLPGTRGPVGTDTRPGSLVAITVWSLSQAADESVRTFFRDEVDPALVKAGSHALAMLETEDAPNTYPGLPVREGAHVIVRVARFVDAAAFAEHERQLGASATWQAVAATLSTLVVGGPVVLRLDPTPRSLLR